MAKNKVNEKDDEKKDGNNALPFGLCKKFGISLPSKATPTDAWNALEKRTGKKPEDFYRDLQSEKWEKAEKIYNSDGIGGEHIPTPAEKKRLEELGIEHTEKKNKVKNVIKNLKTYEGKPVGTYDYNTGELVNLKDGYMVTFHQNEPDENGHYKSHYGRYTEEEYDRIANEFAEQNDAEMFVGVFDDEPEISFKVKTKEQAKILAREYNQDSYWDNEKGEIWKNTKRDKSKNPLRGE